MKKQLFTTMSLALITTAASAGTISVSSTAPTTNVVASGVPDATSFTRVFADGERTDGNEGRGNDIRADSGDDLDLAGLQMTSLVLRKDSDQNFTGSTAFLTIYIFEGGQTDWEAGDGQGDGDLFDGTGITTISSETFALTSSFSEGDYVSFDFDSPIAMAADIGWFVKMDKGNSSETFFQIAQLNNNNTLATQDGRQYQAPDTSQSSFPSPLEYYVVAIPEPGSLALLGLGGLLIARRRGGA